MKNKEIKGFSGEHDWLSNSYGTLVIYEGIRYQNSEAAFQAQKCANIIDKFQFGNLKPVKAQRLGNKVKVRADWEEVKDNLMYEIVRAKFQQHPYLKDLLLATEDAYLQESAAGLGDNQLGVILMGIRNELKRDLTI